MNTELNMENHCQLRYSFTTSY